MATTEFSCDVWSAVPFIDGSKVTFNGYLLPDFYIAQQSYAGGVARITAYDLCKNLDIPFDYSGYDQFEYTYDDDGNKVFDESKAKRYPTSQIVGAIASQCGFTEGGYSGRMAQLCYQDFAGKTCRVILSDLSHNDVGYWHDGGGVLAFVPFSAPSSGLDMPAESDRTEVIRRGTKHITGVYATDEAYGNEYASGSDWRHTERISGRYLTEAAVQQMVSQIVGSGGEYAYHGWECSQMITDYLYNIGDFIAYGGDKLPVLGAVFGFTGLGIVADVSAPEADCSFSEYHDLYSRKLEGKLEANKSYGCFFAGDKGFGLRIEM